MYVKSLPAPARCGHRDLLDSASRCDSILLRAVIICATTVAERRELIERDWPRDWLLAENRIWTESYMYQQIAMAGVLAALLTTAIMWNGWFLERASGRTLKVNLSATSVPLFFFNLFVRTKF